MQALSQFAKDFPLFGGFRVHCVLGLWGGAGVGRGGGRGFCAGHVCAPDCVDAQVFVEDHEEVVEPALAKTFVLEVGVIGVRGVGLGALSVCQLLIIL